MSLVKYSVLTKLQASPPRIVQIGKRSQRRTEHAFKTNVWNPLSQALSRRESIIAAEHRSHGSPVHNDGEAPARNLFAQGLPE